MPREFQMPDIAEAGITGSSRSMIANVVCETITLGEKQDYSLCKDIRGCSQCALGHSNPNNEQAAYEYIKLMIEKAEEDE